MNGTNEKNQLHIPILQNEQAFKHQYNVALGNENKILGIKINGKDLVEIPKSLLSYPHLKTLDLSWNKIDTIPNDLNKFKNLEVLNLSHNKIRTSENTQLPPRIEKLGLSSNLIEEFSFKKHQTVPLRVLSLEKNRIENIPDFHQYSSMLEKINISFNFLHTVEKQFNCLPSLKILNLNNNQLKLLKSDFQNTENLEYLNLSYNRLKNIDIRIGALKNLKILLLKHNLIQKLPITLGNCRNLKKIELQENNLSSLPSTIVNLKALANLNAENNNIRRLPKDIDAMSRLETFSIKGNKLRKLHSIRFLLKLEEFWCTNNDFSRESKRIIEQWKSNSHNSAYRERILKHFGETTLSLAKKLAAGEDLEGWKKRRLIYEIDNEVMTYLFKHLPDNHPFWGQIEQKNMLKINSEFSILR